MAIIQFSNGTRVNFNGQPTQADVEEVATQMGLSQLVPEQENPYGAVFRATGQETPLQAGAKATGNIPTSAWNMAKGIGTAVMNPIDTAKGVGNLLADVGATVTNKLTDITGLGQEREQTTLKALGDVLKERYGSIENAQKTAIEDPFGVGSDIAGILSGGAALTGKTAQLGNLASKTAKVATAPVRVPTRAAVNATGKVAGFGVSQATGLSPETLSTITKNSKAFSEAQKAGTTRVDLADDVFGAINKASDELSDLGQGYDAVRTSGQIVQLSDDWLTTGLDKYGLKFENGKVLADRTSKTRNTTDLNKIQEFIDNWGDSKNFTAQEYLNMRHDLAELAKYDQSGKSTVARQFAQDIREGVLNNDSVREQVPGLKQLDAQYADDVKFYNKIKKEFLNPDGTMKDNAASKIVNAVNASNPQRLERLEKLYPGFTQQAKVIKALEDVENAMGIKVGTYARAGAGIAGIATGNLPLIISSIVATPEIAVPLLKGLGLTGEKVAPVLKAVRNFASDINNFRAPGAVTAYIEKNYPDGVPVGMSIKDVSKSDATNLTEQITKAKAEGKTFDEWVKGQRILFRTEQADEAYKGKAVWGSGKYFGLDRNQVKDLMESPHTGVSTGGKVDTYIAPPDIKIKEVDLDSMTPAEFNKFPSGEKLKEQILEEGYDGLILQTGGDLNLGGDQLVLYKNISKIKTRSQLKAEWDKATPSLAEQAKGKTADAGLMEES